MIVKRNSEIPEANGTEGSKIKKYFQPENTQNEIGFRISYFTVNPKSRTLLHKLQSSEIYYILEGEGILKVNDESVNLKKDDSVLIPPMAKQWIENSGSNDLKFLCIVDPAWKQENEIVLE